MDSVRRGRIAAARGGKMDGLLREGSGPGMPGPYGVAVQQALHFRKRGHGGLWAGRPTGHDLRYA